MVHPLLPDPRETALRVADQQLARNSAWVGKSAKARTRERDRLAAELLPVCEAIAEGLSPLAEAVAGLPGPDGTGGLRGSAGRLYRQEMARRAGDEARLARLHSHGVPAADPGFAQFMDLMKSAAGVVPQVNGSGREGSAGYGAS